MVRMTGAFFHQNHSAGRILQIPSWEKGFAGAYTTSKKLKVWAKCENTNRQKKHSFQTLRDLILNTFFHNCEVPRSSHICFPTKLVFHQHLNLHIAYPGSHSNLQTTREENFCTGHRTLFSDYSDQSLATRSPARGFLTSVTLELRLAQPHCASITKYGHHI